MSGLRNTFDERCVSRGNNTQLFPRLQMLFAPDLPNGHLPLRIGKLKVVIPCNTFEYQQLASLKNPSPPTLKMSAQVNYFQV